MLQWIGLLVERVIEEGVDLGIWCVGRGVCDEQLQRRAVHRADTCANGVHWGSDMGADR